MTPTERAPGVQRRVILAHSRPRFVEHCLRHFRHLGWDVHPVRTGSEVRRLARELPGAVVVLDTDLGDESGWLVCAKLTRERPAQRVILMHPAWTLPEARFAAFAGAAALVPHDDGLPVLMDELLGTTRLSRPA